MQIPVLIVSGFLGSGKTTLLLHLLQQTKAQGLTPGILMNELGKQDVDGWILDEQTDASVQKLLDGCVCCSKKSELSSSLLTLIQGNPDLIVIELTGVANPEEIMAALSAPELQDQTRLIRVITVVDAEHVLDYNSIFASDRQLVHTLRRQLAAADLILINKTDLVSPHKLDKINHQIRKYNKNAAIMNTVHSRVDAVALLEQANIRSLPDASPSVSQQNVSTKMSSSALPHVDVSREVSEYTANRSRMITNSSVQSYSQIKTMTLAYPKQLLIIRQQIEQFLLEKSDVLLRAKGYVSTIEDSQPLLIQYAGHRITWSPSSYPGSSYLVLIGSNMNEQRITEQWQLICQGSHSFS